MDERNNNKKKDFDKTEFFNRLFEKIDEAFKPLGMEFQPDDINEPTRWTSPYHLDGSPSKTGAPIRCQITKEYNKTIFPTDTGDPVGLITWYMNRTGKDYKTAINDLCAVVGMEPNFTFSPEELRLKEFHAKARELYVKMSRDLWDETRTVEVKPIFDYLHGRGYDDQRIKRMGFGYCSRESATALRELITPLLGRDNKGRPKGFNAGVGNEFILAVPYVSGGEVFGFVFRSIAPAPKVRYCYTVVEGARKNNLFDVSGMVLPHKGKRKRIVLVEGIFDALTALAVGIPDVCAVGGTALTREQLERAKFFGVERVVIMFDNDQAGREQTKRAVRLASDIGITPYVANVPQEFNGVAVKDLDEYMKVNHDGADVLKSILDEPLPGALYLYNDIIANREYKTNADGDQYLTIEDEQELRKEVTALCAEPVSASFQDMIINEYVRLTGAGTITEREIRRFADEQRKQQDQARQDRRTKELAEDIKKAVDGGDLISARDLIKDASKELETVGNTAKYERLLHGRSMEEQLKAYASIPDGIKTRFGFGSGEEMQRLIIPSGAVTFIGAPTNHGKSAFLRNLALDVAKDCKDGEVVLYFSFEEERDRVEMQFINTYFKTNLHAPSPIFTNLMSIERYYRFKRTNTATPKNTFISSAVFGEFERVQDEFRREYLADGGKLSVYGEDLTAEDLVNAIRFINDRKQVKAVFVDYVQRLYSTDRDTKRRSRADELATICDDLMRLAIDTQLPVILATQLNRSTVTPLSLTPQNISDASQIEKSANTIILLWNSEKPYSSKEWNDPKNKEERKTVEGDGFALGDKGKLYAIIQKSRINRTGDFAIYDFNGNTGYIESNDDELTALETKFKAEYEDARSRDEAVTSKQTEQTDLF